VVGRGRESVKEVEMVTMRDELGSPDHRTEIAVPGVLGVDF